MISSVFEKFQNMLKCVTVYVIFQYMYYAYVKIMVEFQYLIMGCDIELTEDKKLLSLKILCLF